MPSLLSVSLGLHHAGKNLTACLLLGEIKLSTTVQLVFPSEKSKKKEKKKSLTAFVTVLMYGYSFPYSLHVLVMYFVLAARL